ncbi:MAG: hypothetical protein R3212_08625 [Xanthomonadales bacterium]|nr:hypothetical protein [Xanthomonadales bacterium]
MKRFITLGALGMALVAGCAQSPKSGVTTEVTVLDYRNANGAYVLVYSTDHELRSMFEDRLVADLAARDMLAFASYPDLPDASATTRETLLAAAKARKAMFVLVAEEVEHGQSGVVRSDRRITHEHPTLKDFYAHTKPADHEHDDDAQVFVEVSAFLIQGDFAKLVWSGTTWSFQADGQAGRIAEISAMIANAIDDARRKRNLGFE